MITSETANKIYDILVEECQASNNPAPREQFVFAQSHDNHLTLCESCCTHCIEYRFGGALGFGGKFWHNDNRWYVSAYREDTTPKVKKMIEKANVRLAELKASCSATK